MNVGYDYINNRNKLLKEMKAQRQSVILGRLSGTMNPIEKINQNRIAGSTAKLLTILAGAGIGAGIYGSRSNWGKLQTSKGVLLGILAGALATKAADIGGSIAGDIISKDHKQAMKDYADVGLGRYILPGVSAYHDSKLENALIDTEKGVKRPEQVVF